MPREEWIIHYQSNIAKGTAKDIAHLKGLDNAQSRVNRGRTQYAKGATNIPQSNQKASRSLDILRNKLRGVNRGMRRSVFMQNLMAKSSHTAGINVGMLSLRINEGFIPVLLLSYTAMLPVIAGLLAIASAAIVAGAGLASVIGLGAAAISLRGNSRPIWGARNAFQDESEFDRLLEPLKDVFKSPRTQDNLSFFVKATEDIFKNTLPDALGNFIVALDKGGLQDLIGRFTGWLPEAATNIAKLGNELYNLIGARSLKSINKLFTYIADGLRSTAYWLNDGGFEDLEFFAGTLGRFIGKLTELGKSVLPILSSALDSIYPQPIEPVINLLIDFFDSIKGTATQKAINGLAKIAVGLIILNSAMKFVGAILTGVASIYAFFWDPARGLIPFLKDVYRGISSLSGSIDWVAIRASIGTLYKFASAISYLAGVILAVAGVLGLFKLVKDASAAYNEAGYRPADIGLNETVLASGQTVGESFGNAVLGGTQPQLYANVYTRVDLDGEPIGNNLSEQLTPLTSKNKTVVV